MGKRALCATLRGPCSTPDACLAANECELAKQPDPETLVERLRDEADEQEQEADSWNFIAYGTTNAAAPYIKLAALLREAARAIEQSSQEPSRER